MPRFRQPGHFICWKARGFCRRLTAGNGNVPLCQLLVLQMKGQLDYIFKKKFYKELYEEAKR